MNIDDPVTGISPEDEELGMEPGDEELERQKEADGAQVLNPWSETAQRLFDSWPDDLDGAAPNEE